MEVKVIKAGEGASLLSGRQVIKLPGTETENQIAIIRSVVPEGSGVPMHKHEREDEIFQVLAGKLEVTANGQVLILVQHDIIFLPRLIPHQFKALENVDMWTTFTPGGIEAMFEEMAELPPGPPEMSRISEICGRFGVTFIK